MKKIITMIKPFSLTQYINVYENCECLFCHNVPMNLFSEHLSELAAQYQVTEIDIAGPKIFTKKIKKEIETYNLAHYNENQIKINLI